MECESIEQLSANNDVQDLMWRSIKVDWYADDPWKKTKYLSPGVYIQKFPGVYCRRRVPC